MKINNKMPDEFFDWLDKCPVQWQLVKWDDENINYTFSVPIGDDDPIDEDNNEWYENIYFSLSRWRVQ